MAIVKKPTETRVCEYCQNSYVVTRHWQKTCSYKCGYYFQNSKKKQDISNFGNCARCGKSLAHKKSHALYCSTTCKSMDHTFKHRSKTRFATTARRQEIYIRDNSSCYMCLTKLEFSKIELDHLIPVSRGGDSSSENLAVSCMFCNRSRGSKIGIRQLEKLHELRII
jgi:hypothetical protein